MQPIKSTILLVEDRMEDAELARLAIERCGFTGELKWVKDGIEAMDFLEDRKNEAFAQNLIMILLDLNLPMMSGLEVLKRLKQDQQLRQIPIIMLTTSREEKDVKGAYSYYVNSYVVKPVAFEQFQTMIEKVYKYWAVYNTPAG